jgi:hypothetical protein
MMDQAHAAQVLLPVAPDVDVPEEVFKRSSADVKLEFDTMRERRKQSEVLMTRAMRDKVANKHRKKHQFARIRIRFPEGLTLQGAHLAIGRGLVHNVSVGWILESRTKK